jgi:hypothetical protein
MGSEKEVADPVDASTGFFSENSENFEIRARCT